jgi:hypothetical protein
MAKIRPNEHIASGAIAGGRGHPSTLDGAGAHARGGVPLIVPPVRANLLLGRVISAHPMADPVWQACIAPPCGATPASAGGRFRIAALRTAGLRAGRAAEDQAAARRHACSANTQCASLPLPATFDCAPWATSVHGIYNAGAPADVPVARGRSSPQRRVRGIRTSRGILPRCALW